MSTCTIDGCATEIGKHGARGYCSKHYKRFKKHGDASLITRLPRGSSPEDALHFAGWQVAPNSGCWNFAGRKDPDGYGAITNGRGPYRAHRAAYEAWVGSIPAGHVIRHTCDNRQCINPSHLLTGLPADNTQDAVERQRMANGERHGMHKLTDDEVNSMRCEYARGGVTQRALARRYGCSQAQVNNVLLHKQRADETHLIAA
jgi:hypothetical protein